MQLYTPAQEGKGLKYGIMERCSLQQKARTSSPTLVVSTFPPLKIVARDAETGENLLLFDRAGYGYSALFRDVFSEPQKQYRPLTRYGAPVGRVHINLEYDVPYEQERSKFHFNAMGYVLLRDGRAIPWEQAKRDGFTQISLSLETEEGHIIEFASEYLAYSSFMGSSQAD